MSHEATDYPTTLRHDAQQGNRDAFASLYRLHVDDVTRYVRVRIGERNQDAVEDVVQDTFCTALAELGTAHGDVGIWLIRLAARACTRHEWDQRRYLRSALTFGEHLARASTEPATHARPATDRVTLAHALAMLPPRLRHVAQLRWLEGYPRDLVARQLRRSPDTVRATERQALRRMRAALTTPASAGRPTALRTPGEEL